MSKIVHTERQASRASKLRVAQPQAVLRNIEGCPSGCASVADCTGGCQPSPPVRTGKYCRYCDEGVRLTGTDHWVVQSIMPARIKIVACKGYRAQSPEAQT